LVVFLIFVYRMSHTTEAVRKNVTSVLLDKW
jgi:hypothetical protein